MTDSSDPNITTTQIILFLFVFIIFVIIGITIEDKNLKISYFLVVSLILFTLFNCYLTIAYYKDLRNVGGVQGERGLTGEQGFQGDSGVCTFSDKCGIDDCRGKVSEASIEKYSDIVSENCINTPKECKNTDEKNIAIEIRKTNDVLTKKCENTKLKWEDFKEKYF
jgi:hypothetical protein